MLGVMWSSLVGLRTSNGYSVILVAGTMLPPGRMNFLREGFPVRLQGSLEVQIPEVAPLSAAVDGMDLLSTTSRRR